MRRTMQARATLRRTAATLQHHHRAAMQLLNRAAIPRTVVVTMLNRHRRLKLATMALHLLSLRIHNRSR